MNIAVLGAGAWGSALAIAFARQHRIALWSHNAAHAAELAATRMNRRYLPEAPLPPGIDVTADLPAALNGAELAVVATPLKGLREAARGVAVHRPDLPLLWACKGMEVGSQRLPHQIVVEELGEGAAVGALTGPSFALEVARAQPTALVLASERLEFACTVAEKLNDTRLRIYANDDVVGAEVGGAVKNVLAIATGISDGLGFGLNARAALITRGLAEIARLAEALGARRDTLMGLAGMGDLILTCTGDLSRNRRVGLALAAGTPLQQILGELGHVAEGVSTAFEAARLAADLDVDVPITDAVVAILDGRLNAAEAVELLLSRDPKVE